eukprot:2523312-Pyramimonas_sp.AAC.1
MCCRCPPRGEARRPSPPIGCADTSTQPAVDAQSKLYDCRTAHNRLAQKTFVENMYTPGDYSNSPTETSHT